MEIKNIYVTSEEFEALSGEGLAKSMVETGPDGGQMEILYLDGVASAFQSIQIVLNELENRIAELEAKNSD